MKTLTLNDWSFGGFKKIPGFGIILTLVTVVIYQCMNVITKKVSLNPMVILFFRDCLLIPQFLPPLIYSRSKPFPGNKLGLLAIRSLIDGVDLIILFQALKVLPLGDITMIGAVRVVFTTIYSRLFLKEPCGIFEIFNMLLVLGGILLVVQPPIIFGGQSAYTNQMLIMAGAHVASKAFAGLSFIIARHLRDLHWTVLGLHSRLYSMGEVLIYFFYNGAPCIPSCGMERLSLLILSFLGSTGSATLFTALRYEKAGVVGMVDNGAHLIVSQVFQIVFFNELPGLLQIAGVCLVLVSIISLGVRGIFAEKAREKNVAHN